MPSLLVRYRVRDYDAWRSGFEAQSSTRHADGSLDERIFRNASVSNEVIVLLDWDDLERARLFAGSDDLRETFVFVEVVDEPDLWFLEDAQTQLP